MRQKGKRIVVTVKEKPADPIHVWVDVLPNKQKPIRVSVMSKEAQEQVNRFIVVLQKARQRKPVFVHADVPARVRGRSVNPTVGESTMRTTKKTPTATREAIQQEVDRRFNDVRTIDELADVLRVAMLDVTTGKISTKTCNAINKRAGEIIKVLKLKQRLE